MTGRVPKHEPHTMPQRQPMKVECTACGFSRIIRPVDTELPGEVVIQHGKKTGHRLTVAPFDEQQDPLAP